MDQNRDLSICAVVNVGSHLVTLNRMGIALHSLGVRPHFTILDIVGFNRWNALVYAFPGEAQRIQFKPDDCGLTGGVISRVHWERLNDHATDVLRTISPDLCLGMVDSEYPNWALFTAARRLDIPTLLVQEGPYCHDWILHRPERRDWRHGRAIVGWLLRPPPPVRPAYGSGCGGHIAALSDAYKALFAQAGVEPDLIKVTGAPRFDVLADVKKARRERHPNQNPGPPKALLISQPFLTYGIMSVTETRGFYLEMSSALRKLEHDISFDLRFHPSESQEERELKLEILRGRTRDIDQCQDVSQSLAKYDLLVGSRSTVMLEGMAAGLAVAILDPNTPCPDDLYTSVGIRGTTTAEELADKCLAILREAPVTADSPLLAREMGQLDGRASERVARFIIDLVQARVGRP